MSEIIALLEMVEMIKQRHRNLAPGETILGTIDAPLPELIKRPRGRPRKPEEEKPQPKIKKERNLEPREPAKKGRKVGSISAPWRHHEDGTVFTGPKNKDYAKNYYHEVIKKPCVCDRCGTILASAQKINRHHESMHCKIAYGVGFMPELLE